ncbi:hypothetical protein DRQ50_06860 [bacterium]|nr:MAG: hypothetical protein DRQ50_06860 [bacterium]
MGRPGKRSFRYLLATAIARLARRPPLVAADLRRLRPGVILLVRQHSQLGDMVCTTPALRAIRETWPDATIVLVTAPVNVEVVQGNPHVDQVLTYDKRHWRRPARHAALLRRIRGLRPELALVLTSFSVTSAAIALVSGARWVVGPDSLPWGWDVSRHLFSLELPSQVFPDRHAVAHALAPLSSVGITTDDMAPVVIPTAQEQARADVVMAELDLAPGFLVLHPGAGKMQNVWPAANFAAIIRDLDAGPRQILVLQGPADMAVIRELVTALGPGSAARMAPVLPMGVVAALLTRADRFLCNDTGVMHVAGALGVPTLALFGPTDPRLWKPPGTHVQALSSPHRSRDSRGPEFGWMENITVDEVARKWAGLPDRAVGAKD